MPHKKISTTAYTPAANALHKKTILITGVTDELGHSLAVELAKLGATIILLDKSVKKLETVYDDIEANKGPQPAIFPMDIETADEQDYLTLTQAIADNFKQLDGIILNHAVLGQHSPITHTDLTQWERALKVNLTSNFLLLKHCSSMLNNAEQASCIYISDQVAQQGRAYWGSYSSPKAACLNLIETIAEEWEANTNIHLNTLDPGPINTALRRQALPGIDPNQHLPPASATKAFAYLMDPGTNWPKGKHFSWSSADQTLTEI